MTRALLVVPRRGLAINQYRRARRLLEQRRVQVQVAAPRREDVTEERFSLVPDMELGGVRGGDFDLVVFVGGRGNKEVWYLPEAHRVAREALEAGKVVGAIGTGIGVLIHAGLLRGLRATAPPSLVPMLDEVGARYADSPPVVVDDGVVTVRRPEVMEAFVVELLEQVERRREAARAA